jgi:hypothetical protein
MATSRPMPVRWMAPEGLRQFLADARTDVWSFGVLLWETMSLAIMPYAWLPDGNNAVIESVESGVRLPCPAGCPKSLHDLMLRCWDAVPATRIGFAELVVALGQAVTPQTAAPHSYVNVAVPGAAARKARPLRWAMRAQVAAAPGHRGGAPAPMYSNVALHGGSSAAAPGQYYNLGPAQSLLLSHNTGEETNTDGDDT